MNAGYESARDSKFPSRLLGIAVFHEGAAALPSGRAAQPAGRGACARYSPGTADCRASGMNQKPVLTSADVKSIAAAAEAEAAAHGWAVSIAIVDDGGHPLWLQRLDGAAPISAQIGLAKARTAALGRRESKIYEDMINQGRTSFLSAPELSGMLEGGVPVLVGGQCVGAVGVSGVKSSEDAQVARAGIAAVVPGDVVR